MEGLGSCSSLLSYPSSQHSPAIFVPDRFSDARNSRLPKEAGRTPKGGPNVKKTNGQISGPRSDEIAGKYSIEQHGTETVVHWKGK